MIMLNICLCFWANLALTLKIFRIKFNNLMRFTVSKKLKKRSLVQAKDLHFHALTRAFRNAFNPNLSNCLYFKQIIKPLIYLNLYQSIDDLTLI